ncbi:MAG: hypothetical protein IPQ04_08595 [Saprospiraceae bacterium]|nr:hypothetical protein [Saprospiraceae bacterium]
MSPIGPKLLIGNGPPSISGVSTAGDSMGTALEQSSPIAKTNELNPKDGGTEMSFTARFNMVDFFEIMIS